MADNTQLSFEILPTANCKLLFLADTSTYYNADLVENNTLQVVLPGDSPSGDVIELSYYINGITILNSNTLGITNVASTEDLTELPDGLYIGKISICPFTGAAAKWFEKKWYRTCRLECKFLNAFLTLKLDQCNNCYPPKLEQQLDYIERLITGIHANVGNCDWKSASELYTQANTLLDRLVECDCPDC